MIRGLSVCSFGLVIALLLDPTSAAFTFDMKVSNTPTRRSFLNNAVTAVGVSTFLSKPAKAAPEILTTPNGIKYATLTPAKEKNRPRDRDIVAIEYTGYLTDGTIFDSTHAEGKKVSK